MSSIGNENVIEDTHVEEKKKKAPPKPKEVMTKELMIQRVNPEIAELKEQAENLTKIVADLEMAARADAAATTVESINKAIGQMSDIRPALKRVRDTLRARVLERVK